QLGHHQHRRRPHGRQTLDHARGPHRGRAEPTLSAIPAITPNTWISYAGQAIAVTRANRGWRRRSREAIMSDWPGLDRFLATDPRDVGCQESLAHQHL